MKRSNTVEIPSALLRQIVLSHIAVSEGRDALTLMNEADVDFVDSADQHVALDSAIVTWEGK